MCNHDRCTLLIVHSGKQHLLLGDAFYWVLLRILLLTKVLFICLKLCKKKSVRVVQRNTEMLQKWPQGSHKILQKHLKIFQISLKHFIFLNIAKDLNRFGIYLKWSSGQNGSKQEKDFKLISFQMKVLIEKSKNGPRMFLNRKKKLITFQLKILIFIRWRGSVSWTTSLLNGMFTSHEHSLHPKNGQMSIIVGSNFSCGDTQGTYSGKSNGYTIQDPVSKRKLEKNFSINRFSILLSKPFKLDSYLMCRAPCWKTLQWLIWFEPPQDEL